METLGVIVRLTIVFTGFVAMYGLWVSWRDRRHLWTQKMRDLWLCMMLFVAAVIEGNIELAYRKVFPTTAGFFVFGVLLLLLKAVFSKEPYLKNEQPSDKENSA